jgi:hypothetical protein
VKKHIQISINKLRDRSRLYLNLSTRATSFNVKKSFTLMTPVLSTLPFLSSPKITYSLCDRGVRLENHFLFLVMCHEQLEYMSHVFSRPLFITYIGREKVKTNPSLFCTLLSLRAAGKTSRSVTHPEIAPGQARSTSEFFSVGLPKKKVYTLVV